MCVVTDRPPFSYHCRPAASPPAGTSISALAFNRDGTQLAVAASYAFEQGDRPHPADAILVRAVADSDVRPKAAGAGGAVPK